MTHNKDVCIGIDLGTTFSCVSYYEGEGKITIIPNENGNRITPSYVSFTNTERLIGDLAKKNCGQNPKNTIYAFKRFMGSNITDVIVQEEKNNVPYKIIADENNKTIFEVEFMNETKQFYPEQISAMILENLKNCASKFLGYEVKKAVVTVPAYFNDAQRGATKNAGIIAGLDIIRIINEPTSASLAYGIDNMTNQEKNVLVYDFGGGTLDCSILSIDSGVFQVKSTSGDTHLGGEDFDNKLRDYCFMKFCDKYILQTKLNADNLTLLFNILRINDLSNIQKYSLKKLIEIINYDIKNIQVKKYLEQLYEVCKLYNNPKLMRRLKTVCEESKKELSVSDNTTVIYDNFYDSNDLSINITKSFFEKLCDDEFERCINPINDALSCANLVFDNISDVVLVGGSTRIPRIREILESKFPGKLRTNINPDEAVSIGASINASIINNNDKITDGIVLIDVIPLSLGIETAGGIMEVMIKRNTPIPAEYKQVFSTHTDNQPSATIKIFEGERIKTKDNNLLGKFELTNLPEAPKGKLRIEVIYNVDANGITHVSAKELSLGIVGEIVIKNSQNRLNENEINEMIKNAERFLENDNKIRETHKSKNSLEHYLSSSRKILTNQKFIDNLNDNNKLQELNELLNDISNWLENNNDERTKEEYDEQYRLIESSFLPLLV
uniref:Mitochondrial-type heat shock protein 70 n=1 Tax=viral metagenome TaxID=1070528 RepID=A0A6C0E092_9ZZZZ